MECQRFGFLKRGKPMPGISCFFAARKRLRALERRSASICTVVAGTWSPCPLKASSRSYLLGNVPSCSYCALTVSSMLLYIRRDSLKHCISKRSCSLFVKRRYSNVLMTIFYHDLLELSWGMCACGGGISLSCLKPGPSSRFKVERDA